MRLSVKFKLGLTFGVVIVLSVITALLGVTNLASLNATMAGVLAGPVERVQLAQDLKSNLLLGVRAEKNLILEAADAEARTRFDAELLKQREVFAGQLDRLDAVASAEGKKILASLRAIRPQWIETNDKIRSLSSVNQVTAAIALSVGQGRDLITQQERLIGDFLDLQQRFLDQAKADAALQYENTRWVLIAACMMALLIGIGAASWMA